MRKLTLAICLTCLLAVMSSCVINLPHAAAIVTGNRIITESETALSSSQYKLIIKNINFTGTNSGGEITIDEALDRKLTLSTDENILDSISVTVDGDEITIEGDKSVKYRHSEFKIITGAKINAFEIDGGYDLTMDAPSLTAFEGTVNGAINADMVFKKLDSFAMTVNGACNVDLEGKSEKSAIVLNGAGKISALSFETINNSVTINGTGSCELYVTGTLDVAINGLGTVTYDGEPESVNKSGIGTLNKR